MVDGRWGLSVRWGSILDVFWLCFVFFNEIGS